MRILLLTPGTGSFHCGTCIRDNALALALRRLGHDALMVPMYLPPTLDEASAAENAPLFYGGVNVYLQQMSGLFRSAPRWVDKWLDSPGVLQQAAKRAGSTQASDLGAMTLSMLKGEEGKQNKELDKLLEWLVTPDGKADVILLSNALLMGLGRRIKQETGAFVACTLQGEDTFLDALGDPFNKQCWEAVAERARDFDAFIAVSNYHAGLMTRRASLPKDQVHVVYNGITLDGFDAPLPDVSANVPVLGYLSRMCPPKGLGVLVETFIALRKRGTVSSLRLRVAGAQTEGDVDYVNGLKAKLQAEGLETDVEFFPNVSREEKIRFLRGLSVFSVPATYGESFGLYVLEALAAGVPVVQPRHAVFPELLNETGGGVLYDADNTQSHADAIEKLLLDPASAKALGAEGRQNVYTKFGVDTMARNVAAVFTGSVD